MESESQRKFLQKIKCDSTWEEQKMFTQAKIMLTPLDPGNKEETAAEEERESEEEESFE